MQINPTEIPAEVQQAKSRFGIIGNSQALVTAITRAIQVAPIDLSVLITGESGTGKEFFPKIIHSFSARKHSKYIAVNCGAIPEGTIDSELFGHEKGSFTGAISPRKGYFEEADGGTIFLDEVAELPLSTQARLLRVLESGEFLKVGSSTVQKTNIRIVAATNVDLLKAIEEKKFREDLYYRLSTVHISVPPLRDRGNDIFLLARKFASDFAEKYQTPPITLNDDARRLIQQYRWPGNVRQLKNIIERVALYEAGSEINAEYLETQIPQNATVYAPTVSGERVHSYASEREILFNMIFRMQREIDTLREKLEHYTPESTTQIKRSNEPVLEEPTRSLVKIHPSIDSIYTPSEHDTIVDISESETMTLEDTEKETIRRSLERNGGRRKATAQELNISERTLYRKIKEFELE